MGVWSASLFGNDTACDVRDTYIECLKQQMSDEEAYEKTYEEYAELIGTDEEPLFWYSLALTQWRVGRLTDEVKNKALQFISVKGGLDLYEESKKASEKWKSTLECLKENLNQAMPQRKKFRKPVEYVRNPWNVGDVYAYQFHTEYAKERNMEGKIIIMQKIGDIVLYGDEIYSIVQVFDCVYDIVPSIEEAISPRILPLTLPPGHEWMPKRKEDYVPSFESCLRAAFTSVKKSDYPEKYLSYIGNVPCEKIEYLFNEISDFSWDKSSMDEWLCDFFINWQNVRY